MSSEPPTRYCRGCNTEVRDESFGVYKQCGECRLKAVTRTRKSETCVCGRTLLACSLKVHLRSIYHAEHIAKAVGRHKPLPVINKLLPPASKPVIRVALPKPMSESIKQPQPYPVIIPQPRPTVQPPSAAKASSAIRS